MQHAGQFEINQIGVFARDFQRNITARHGLADELIKARILWFRLATQLDIKAFAADQFAIGQAFFRRADHNDDPVGGCQLRGRDVQSQGRQRQQCGARFGTRISQRTTAVDDAV